MYGYESKKKRLGQHFLLPSWGAKAKKVKGGVSLRRREERHDNERCDLRKR